MPTSRCPAADICGRVDDPARHCDVGAATAHVRSSVRVSHPSAALQCKSIRQNASEIAPIRMSVTAQVASRLNQLRDTNFNPR